MWPVQWQEPAAVLWCRGRGFCEWRRSRRKAAGWARGQTDQTTRWWSTCPASPPGGPGRACPGSSLPQGTQCQRGSTCRWEFERHTEHFYYFLLSRFKTNKTDGTLDFLSVWKEPAKEQMSFSLQHQRHWMHVTAWIFVWVWVMPLRENPTLKL